MLAGVLIMSIGFVLLFVALVIFVKLGGDGGCLVFCSGGVGLIMVIVGVIMMAIDLNTPVSAVLPGAVQYLDAMYLI